MLLLDSLFEVSKGGATGGTSGEIWAGTSEGLLLQAALCRVRPVLFLQTLQHQGQLRGFMHENDEKIEKFSKIHRKQKYNKLTAHVFRKSTMQRYKRINIVTSNKKIVAHRSLYTKVVIRKRKKSPIAASNFDRWIPAHEHNHLDSVRDSCLRREKAPKKPTTIFDCELHFYDVTVPGVTHRQRRPKRGVNATHRKRCGMPKAMKNLLSS